MSAPEIERTIRVVGLVKRYGSLTAVNDIEFEVARGEVFCLVGPNGAGKTTTMECLEGLRKPDAGSVRVLDMNPFTEQQRLQRRIGVQLQEASLPARLRVGEALRLFSVLYERPTVPWQLLDQLGLKAKKDTYYDKLSGGQKQRLFVALALINEPEVIFLDELTTGLDPHARQSIWALIRNIRDLGTTVVLSTHFMDEAEALADRVAIMQEGSIVAQDSPLNLISGLRRHDQLALRVEGELSLRSLEAVEGVSAARYVSETIEVEGSGRGWIARLVNAIEGEGVMLLDLRTHQPTLEEVYLAVTGEEQYMPTKTEADEALR